MLNSRLDCVIIGAGPAGSVAAALLHRQGQTIAVLEKQRFPRFVIGESLLPHCMDYLEAAGLLEAVRSRGYLRKHGAVFLRGKDRRRFDFSSQFTSGWAYTYQVPRADFDMTLANRVAANGVPYLHGHSVTGVEFGEDVRVRVSTPEGSERTLRSRFVLDCSGYGRVLPRLLGLEKPSPFPVREALFAHVRGDRRPTGVEEGDVWACVHPGGAWLWVIPFADGVTSVGAVGEPEFFHRFDGSAKDQLLAIIDSDPNTSGRLSGCDFVLAPRRLEGYACAVQRMHGPRFALAGNATEFLDPIFSSGVTLALASASHAATLIGRQLRGDDVDWDLEYSNQVMKGVDVFRAYVRAWYDGTLRDILFANRTDERILSQICSVLAGYVWDDSNPYAVQAERGLALLGHLTGRPS